MNKHRKAGATIGQRSVEKMRVGVKWGGYTWERSSNTFFTFCFKMSRKLSWLLFWMRYHAFFVSTTSLVEINGKL